MRSLKRSIVGKPVQFYWTSKKVLTPPHELLKSKLFSYGIGGKTLKWINAFLCYRQQRVVVNGVKSDWALVLLLQWQQQIFLLDSY